MDTIRIARKKRGLTMKALGKMVGLSEGAISQYETGKRQPPYDTLFDIAKVLNVSVNYLLTGEEDREEAPEAGERRCVRVPLVGRVAAGTPIMGAELFETWVDSPVPCDAAMVIQGDSMLPVYQPGDVVYIRRTPVVDDGQVAVVMIDDEATLKHVYRNPQGLTLTSDNPAYPPIYVIGKDHDYIAVYGVPVGYTRIYQQKGDF